MHRNQRQNRLIQLPSCIKEPGQLIAQVLLFLYNIEMRRPGNLRGFDGLFGKDKKGGKKEGKNKASYAPPPAPPEPVNATMAAAGGGGTPTSSPEVASIMAAIGNSINNVNHHGTKPTCDDDRCKKLAIANTAKLTEAQAAAPPVVPASQGFFRRLFGMAPKCPPGLIYSAEHGGCIQM